jgi:hypothetical protein
MNKLLKNIVTIITILAGISGLVGLYIQIKEHNPELEIKALSLDKLTDLPSVDGLKANYLYKNDTVNSLWKLHYLVSNVGDELIIGQGNKKNIIKDDLKFNINDGFKILEVKNENNPNFNIQLKSNQIFVDFLQWKSQESIEIVIYTQQTKKDVIPSFTTNEREIINGKVSYTALLDTIVKKEPLFNKLPKTLQSILWWFGIVFFGLLLVLIPIVWFSELVKLMKYKKWEKSDFWMYEEWVNDLIKEDKIESFKNPKDLPNKLWSEYPYIKPTINDNEFGNLSLGVIVILFLFIIPLLMLIEV